ncbi:MAG: pyridoxamine 5'-phosphate oxidase family protein [Hyphomicrobiaceae bacterium]|nr:pyridoxamine 5'-phosphate oxidase family protein [Hyphomicrobiaceae bacterium]
MLTPDMKRIIDEQRLGFVATCAADGTPNVSPKATFVVLDERTIAFGDLRSPGTLRNLKENPRIEVNFVDPFVRKGYRFAGRARIVPRGDEAFADLIGKFSGPLADRMQALVVITLERVRPLISPGYDDGTTETELRRQWTARFRKLQPNARFEE